MDTKKLIKDVLDAHEAGSLRHYIVAHTPGGGLSISADGAEDHARAMEALAAMQRLASAPPSVLVAPAPPMAPAKPTLLLSAAVELFLKQFGQKQRAESNVLDTGHTLKVLVGVVGDKPLAEVDAQDMDAFFDAIGHLPPNATKHWPQLTVTEVIIKAKAEGLAGLSHRTQEKHLDRLRVFFGWAFERGDIARNPAKTLHVMTRAQEDASTREAFTPAELARIFDPTTRAAECDQPHRWWGPLLALFTGARVTEIAQLWTDDLEEIDGIWGFHFAPRTERGQRIKNAVSKRFVPAHPALLEAGLLAYRDEVVATFGTSRLLPGLSKNKPGDTLGDWFNRTYRKVVKVDGVFHGFRHTFASRAERCGLSDARLGRLTGHSAGGSVLRRHYIDPPTLAERAADIAKVQFEGLPTIASYHTGQFAPFFAVTQRRIKIEVAKETRRQRNLKNG
ncbi:hypothetical protein [Luteibacter sp. CQ10]|uniref:hypothetical protein n=1 Tax=Luteibacter sp. CQ10 TaxID=2805821 RepID=UPI0034A1DB76